MVVDSTRRSSRRKSTSPKKARPDFSLSIHKGSGYWCKCKKVRGKVHYFGKIADDPKGVAALDRWLEQKDDLITGREPRTQTGELTVADLANAFRSHKEHLRDNGELSPRTFQGYHATCETIVNQFGKNRVVTMLIPDDFRKLRGKLTKTVRERSPQRPKAKDPTDAQRLFLTCRGSRWVKVNKDGYHNDALGQELRKVAAQT